MNELNKTLLISNIYRILCLFMGFCFAFLGYRLFMAGVTAPGIDGQAQTVLLKLIFKGAAPGSFFAICGVIISVLGVVRPVVLSSEPGNGRPGFDPATITSFSMSLDPKNISKQGKPSSSTHQDSFIRGILKKAVADGEQLTPGERSQVMSLLNVSDTPSFVSLQNDLNKAQV